MEDWRAVLAQYEADKSSGVIRFGRGENDLFACTYPGQEDGERQIAEWLRSHLPDAVIDFLPTTDTY